MNLTLGSARRVKKRTKKPERIFVVILVFANNAAQEKDKKPLMIMGVSALSIDLSTRADGKLTMRRVLQSLWQNIRMDLYIDGKRSLHPYKHDFNKGKKKKKKRNYFIH